MRKLILVLVLMATVAPLDAKANDVIRDRIVSELQQDGYAEIRVFRTFLGRLRFVAQNGTTRREIVVNPATGVILRDYLRVVSTTDGSSSNSGSSSGSGSSGGSTDDDDDDDDDDNSGSGGGGSGSGSGSGGSGSGGGDDDDDGGSDSDDDSGDDD